MMLNKITFLMAILVGTLIADNFLYYFLLENTFNRILSSPFGSILFIALSIIPFISGQYILSNLVKQTNIEVKNASPSFLSRTYCAVKVAFYVNAAIAAAIILEISFTARYHVGLTILAVNINYLLGCMIYSTIIYRFFSWFRSKRDKTILLLGISFTTALVGAAIISLVNTAAFFMESRDYGLQTMEQSRPTLEGTSYEKKVKRVLKPLHCSNLRISLFERHLFCYGWLRYHFCIVILKQLANSSFG